MSEGWYLYDGFCMQNFGLSLHVNVFDDTVSRLRVSKKCWLARILRIDKEGTHVMLSKCGHFSPIKRFGISICDFAWTA
jgi:hypothetical protein